MEWQKHGTEMGGDEETMAGRKAGRRAAPVDISAVGPPKRAKTMRDTLLRDRPDDPIGAETGQDWECVALGGETDVVAQL